MLAATLTVGIRHAFPAPATRAEALAALEDPQTERRAEAVVWLANHGRIEDQPLLLKRLHDESAFVRGYAEQGLWLLWARSGDAEIDRLMAAGVDQMQAGRHREAVATFTAPDGQKTVARQPLSATVVLPARWMRSLGAANRICQVLSLRIDPLRLNLLGLIVEIPEPVTLTITGVTQDEPVDATGDGATAPDAEAGTTPNEVQLRAERKGDGDGRVYRIAFTLSDGKGGTCSGFVTVGVPHDQGNGLAPVDSAPPSYDSFGS